MQVYLSLDGLETIIWLAGLLLCWLAGWLVGWVGGWMALKTELPYISELTMYLQAGM